MRFFVQFLVENADYELLVNALVGFVGLRPTLRAIELKKDIALANKETLVAGGEIVKKAVAKYQTKDTLVYNMTLIYHQRESKINSYYYIILRSDNNCDTFKVSAYDISNLLEIFNIM